MIWKIDRLVIQDVLTKLGLSMIVGGFVGVFYSQSVNFASVIHAVTLGVVFILIGALRPNQTGD